ncbi:argonaute MEL1-like [Olea europaea subsp. europaea]|uniref:Argonaute MEL1-like n=1 Tax=Olea europaea subsp. europaea TaxID=158383 RepID=A0A8S0PAZ6_OLEEU|nr:argonaute MEL1-like [Olea europaea subsp. europaea]
MVNSNNYNGDMLVNREFGIQVKSSEFAKQSWELSRNVVSPVGGRNTVLELASNRRMPYLTDCPTIIFGADVVASVDWPKVTKYSGLVSAQSPQEEIIQDLYKTTEDPNRGTVIDTKICHPNGFDFYLCSHAGTRVLRFMLFSQFAGIIFVYTCICFGTSRLTHYHVLFDENKFSADALQLLTNSLCYTCTRLVSIVHLAYYAHLAAFLDRYYVEDGELSDSGSAPGRDMATREKNLEVAKILTLGFAFNVQIACLCVGSLDLL